MRKKIKKRLLFALCFFITASLSAGTAVAIILPNTYKLKKGLEQFVTGSSGKNNYESFANKKLFYVALGDSLASGHNGTLKRETYSYADFLANNLKKSNKLAGYKNFASNGNGILSSLSNILKNPSKMHAIKKADIISLSIGSNDILSVMKFLELGFTDQLNIMTSDVDYNKNKENIERKKININNNLIDPNLVENKKYAVGQASSPLNKGEKYHILRKSIHKFVKMYKNKDFSEIITISSTWNNKIMNFIERNIILFIHDIHLINPEAQIIFVSPCFPFPHWPKKNIQKTHSEINQSILQIYNNLINRMKEAVEFSLSGNNKFVDFIDISKLKITKTVLNKDINDDKKIYFKDYIKKQQLFSEIKDQKTLPNYWKTNAFHNSMDIHPSIFGNQLIGNALFSRIFKYLNIPNAKSEDFYTFSKPYVDEKSSSELWTRLDEAPSTFNIHKQYIVTNLLNNKGNFFYSLIKILENRYPNNDFQDTINKYITDLDNLSYDDYIPILEIMNNNDFIDRLISVFDKKNEIWDSINKIKNTSNLNVQNLEIQKISKYLDSFSDSDWPKKKNRLWNISLDKLRDFEKRTKNRKLRNFFESIIQFLISPTINSAINLRDIV